MKDRILDYFPYDTPREVQEEALLAIEELWDRYDVFVIIAPTATGKLPLSLTIAEWSGNARIINPNNMLVNQAAGEFSHVPTLIGKDNYVCKNGSGYSCGAVGGCRGCTYNVDARAFYSSSVGITNYHLYALSALRDRRNLRRTLIIDEAHNVIPFLQDQHSLHFWYHRGGFPYYAPQDREALRKWLSTIDKPSKKHLALLEDIESDHPRFVLDKGYDLWRGGGVGTSGERYIRSEPVELPQLVAKPINIRGYPETLWPRRGVDKVVLLSATINHKDIETLGLDNRRVAYVECESPIPVSRRPVYLDYVTTVSRARMDQATETIAERILQLAAHYPNVKGLVHATYEQALILRKYLKGGRFLFHTALDKGTVYDTFRDAPEESGVILIGSGMYEGLDLKYDLARWQGIAKVPWASKADAAVDYLSDMDPDWYLWDTAKNLIQACGRISRTPTDYGETYIWDRSFERIVNSDLLPKWFTETIVEEK